MERARRLANRAILRRLVSEAKQNRQNGSLMHSPSPVCYTPSRYVSSLTPYVFVRRSSRSDFARNVAHGVGSQTRSISVEALKPSDTFPRRHNSATPEDQIKMASLCGFDSLDSLIDATVPKSIRISSMKFSKFDEGLTESQMLEHMQNLASKNKIFKSYIGMGYYNTYVPPVILRNIMENPAWYTQYTPYQAEISQGRLESLLNFQTLITDLTGLPMSNASLLDEGTAAAEAMAMCNNIQKGKKKTFIIASNCHPQTIDICKTRADGFDLKVVTADLKNIDYKSGDVCGVLVQYPGTEGEILDYGEFVKNAHAHGVKVVMATDLLALTMLKPPGEFGADIVVGSAQRFGVPMGYGGPHAAFLATSQEYKRMMPGRIIGVSVDSSGKPALRMAMQTREQHIRRDKATSNICTAQALLANMAAMYAVYHGPEGLKVIAQRVHGLAGAFALGLKKLGTAEVQGHPFFDTVAVKVADANVIADAAYKSKMNLRVVDPKTITVSFDETTTLEDVDKLLKVFAGGKPVSFTAESLAPEVQTAIPSGLIRDSPYLTHPIFNTYHTEHELLRYIHKLQSKDLSLCHSMIPLGSCTMKLNATTEMMPVTWPSFADIHPFAPTEQAQGYQEMFDNLGDLLCTITGIIIKASKEQIQSMSQHEETPPRIWPFGGDSTHPFNLFHKRPSQSNKFGRLYETDPNECKQLQDLDLMVSFANITKGSMAGPYYNSRATQISVVIEGEGYFEMACPHRSSSGSRGQREGSGSSGRRSRSGPSYQQSRGRLRRGTVFVAPAGYPVAVIASRNKNLQVLCFEVNAQGNVRFPLAGKNNIVNEFEREAKELAFSLPAREVEKIFRNQDQEFFFPGPSRQQEEGGRAFE